MRIVGLEGLEPSQVHAEVQRGGRFVVFQFCVSILIMSFKRSSSVHFIRAGENPLPKSIQFSLLSVLLGWWGIPWGPIWTISTTVKNCQGGIDVTKSILPSLAAPQASQSGSAA